MRDDIETNALVAAFPTELAKNHGRYDSEARLLVARGEKARSAASGREGAARHSLRPSLSYGVALLDTGDPAYHDRAVDVIEAVIDEQNTDRERPFYGCWPHFAEQSLEEVPHVDLNWAVFLARDLIYALEDHADRLPERVVDRISRSLERAATCAKRRDVMPAYTNISAMSAYVVVKAGTLLGDEELLAFGRDRLRELVGYTRYNDGFTEYNSPTYTVITLAEIGRMLAYFEDEDDRALARVLNDYVWRSIATHYHPPTAKLAGPHSRTYDDEYHDDVGGRTLRSILHAGTGGEYGLHDDEAFAFFENDPPMDLNWHKLVLDCPEAYYPLFPVPGARFERHRFYEGAEDDQPANELTLHEAPGSVEARSYLSPEMSLGTFTKSQLWNQRRALVGYWGDPAEPEYVRLRCLKDGRDFYSAMLGASQYENHVLGGVSFVTDWGPVAADGAAGPGSIEVESLVVRFEVGTEFTRSLERIEVLDRNDAGTTDGNDEGTRLRVGDAVVDVTTLYGGFDGDDPTIRTGERRDSEQDRGCAWVDVVLYDGEPTVIDLESVADAAVVFGLTVAATGDTAADDVSTPTYVCDRLEDGRVDATMREVDYPGTLRMPTEPCSYAENFDRTVVDEGFRGVDDEDRSNG